MLKEIQDLFVNEILEKEKELSELQFKYIQFLMAFIPDKDLVNIYEKYNIDFSTISQMSKELLLKSPHILNLTIKRFEKWIKDNYNITLDYTK